MTCQLLRETLLQQAEQVQSKRIIRLSPELGRDVLLVEWWVTLISVACN
jgi:hypothetical protein